jgi:hypothetical protein
MEKVQAIFVLEILGRPPEHLSSSLEMLVNKLGSEKGVKILNKTLNEPVKVEKSETLYTSFAEIELEFESLDVLLSIIFSYMPAHIEIIHPERLNISNANLNDLFNVLVRRLHEYDAITKKVLFERDKVLEKLKELNPELFRKKESTEQPIQEVSEKKISKKKSKKSNK